MSTKVWQPTLEEWNTYLGHVQFPYSASLNTLTEGIRRQKEFLREIGIEEDDGAIDLRVIIPEGVELVKFREVHLYNITEIDFADSVKRIEFSNIDSKTRKIRFGSGLQSISLSSLYSKFPELEDLELPAGRLEVTYSGNSIYPPEAKDGKAFRYGGMTVSLEALDQFYGLDYDNFGPILKELEANGIKNLTAPVAAFFNREYHKDNSYSDHEHFQNACKLYKQRGALDCEYRYDEQIKDDLERLFKGEFRQVPRIVGSLAVVSTQYNIPADQIVRKFDISRTKAFLSAGVPHMAGGILLATLNRDDFDKAIKSPYVNEIAELCAKSYKYRDLRYLNAAEWIINHPRSNMDLIMNIHKNAKDLDLFRTTQVEKIKSRLSLLSSVNEMRRIEEEYEFAGFRFEDCEFNLQFCDVELGQYKAGILKPGDTRMATLGASTCCCQRLGEAGETAMMYGLAAPNAGFWAIEDKTTGKILAQAEIWETKESILVSNVPYNFHDENAYLALDRVLTQAFEEERLDFDAVFLNCEYNDGILEYKGTPVATIDRDGYIIELYDLKAVLECIREEGWSQRLNEILQDGFSAVGPLSDENPTRYAYLDPDGILRNADWRAKNLSEAPILVMDNIEFADDRDISQFAPIIGKWLEKSDYENVLMGNGYNAMEQDKFDQASGVEPPLDSYIVQLMDNEQIVLWNEDVGQEHGFGSPDQFYEALAEDLDYWSDVLYEDNNYFKPYSDATESCSVLKLNGEVAPYLQQAYEQEKQQEEKTPAKTQTPKKEKTLDFER